MSHFFRDIFRSSRLCREFSLLRHWLRLAQWQCLEENKGKLAFFGGIKNAKFRKQVVPGDVLKLETEIIKCKGPMGVGKAVATVNGKVAAEAEISFICSDAK